MFNKKLKKLARNPHLFFSDMLKKQNKKINNICAKKIEGHHQYTVVSAVFNVGRYLDDYFKSLVNQKLDFKKSIHIILVDDGSTDDSAQIIEKWKQKYPKNITYIWKENGGQASARNLGLEHVKTEWVTFIDPDDFVDKDYFFEIDNYQFCHKSDSFIMISCNVIFYIEDCKIYKDIHPLSFKYSKGNVSYSSDDIRNNIQLYSNSVLFKTDAIINNEIKFDPQVKPNFEDGKFNADYLMVGLSGEIAFLQSAKYFYRKRNDGTSTLDTSWSKVERYTNVTRNGYLEILQKYQEKYSYVPVFIQRTVLYDIIWNLKQLVNHYDRVCFLSDVEKEIYFNSILDIFKYIDKEVIMSFELAGCWFYHKMGMLGCFKNMAPDFQIVYIERYDKFKSLVQLRYFTYNLGLESISIDGLDTFPLFAKTIQHDFVGNNFLLERRIWIDINDVSKLAVSIGNLQTNLSLGGKQHKAGIKTADIKKHFLDLVPKYEKISMYEDSWILMDRDHQADDNAEHLYRYIQKNHPLQKIFFVLSDVSHDWKRLSLDGFNLINYGSIDHENALKSCSKVISSHANYYVTNYLGKKMLANRHFVFLQHGITKDDLSGWLNNKDNIDCFITATKKEYESITKDYTKYNYNEKEVILSGFPRHDSLISNAIQPERLILIMPTWRQNAVGPVAGQGDERLINPGFVGSDFYKYWASLLHSEKFKALIDQYHYKVVFFPHSLIHPYINDFKVPDYIEVVTHRQGSIQELFSRAAMMITDYSSAAFEMAVQKKQSLYFQFDENMVFSGGHTYAKGYFNYREDAFGPVVNNLDELFYELDLILQADSIPNDKIVERIENTFPDLSGNNCDNVFRAIKALDEQLGENYYNISIVKDYILQAVNYKLWALVESRLKLYFSICDECELSCHILLVKALRMQGKFEEAIDQLDKINNTSGSFGNDTIQESALLSMAMLRWDEAICHWNKIGSNKFNNADYLFCIANSSIFDNGLFSGDLDSFLYKVSYNYALGSFDEVFKLAGEYLNTGECVNNDEHIKSLILIASAYRKCGSLAIASDYLTQARAIDNDDFYVLCEIIRLDFKNENYKSVIKNIYHHLPDLQKMPFEFMYYYAASLFFDGRLNYASDIVDLINENDINTQEELSSYADILCKVEQWYKAVIVCERIHDDNFKNIYNLSLSLKNVGNYDRGFIVLSMYDGEFTSEGWKLRSELAQLTDHWLDAYNSWLQYLRSIPVQKTLNDMDMLQRLKAISQVSA